MKIDEIQNLMKSMLYNTVNSIEFVVKSYEGNADITHNYVLIGKLYVPESSTVNLSIKTPAIYIGDNIMNNSINLSTVIPRECYCVYNRIIINSLTSVTFKGYKVIIEY